MIPDRANGRGPGPALAALWTTGALAAGVLLGACAPPAPDGPAQDVRTELPDTGSEQPPAAEPSSPSTSSSTTSSSGTSSTTSAPEPSTSRPAQTSPPSTSKRQPAPVDRCHTGQLAASIEEQDAGAGQRYADVVLRNNGSQPCTVYGYGGMQLVGGNGEPIPTNLERVPNPGPSLVRLDPGASTRATLHWTVVPTGDEPTSGPCEPEAASVRVTPPDERAAQTVPWDRGPVCDHGRIQGSAYH